MRLVKEWEGAIWGSTITTEGTGVRAPRSRASFCAQVDGARRRPERREAIGASPPPRHHARPVHRRLRLVVEVADEADELAEALDVEDVEWLPVVMPAR